MFPPVSGLRPEQSPRASITVRSCKPRGRARGIWLQMLVGEPKQVQVAASDPAVPKHNLAILTEIEEKAGA